eukprot:TRINITY_DN33030_c0_g1_i1.p1 TRINITY_DN33030_c0_g1~~TRINITY_DN33030_c0_g1_i1.p1  ORF type:complete len:654 (+),score=95.47 TRINITY_DN33030_c0_g1_i1:128-1963(+)
MAVASFHHGVLRSHMRASCSFDYMSSSVGSSGCHSPREFACRVGKFSSYSEGCNTCVSTSSSHYSVSSSPSQPTRSRAKAESALCSASISRRQSHLQRRVPSSPQFHSEFLSGSRLPSCSGTLSEAPSRTCLGLSCRAESSSSFLDVFKQGKKKVETDALPKNVRDRTISAVEFLGGRVTVGDVAAKAGVKISEAEVALRALAADTGGFLEVSNDGDVLYVFKQDFRNALRQKSLQLRLEPVLENVKFGAEYLTRVAFGTALLASIVITTTAIVAILSSSKSDERENNRGGSYRGGPTFFLNPGELLWYLDPYYYRRPGYTRRRGGVGSFFEGVFSFVFGDGDPNKELEETRWRTVGDIIAKRGGVVTAEDLAPYLNPPPLDIANGSIVPADEAFMIPVLQRLDGVPEVDEEGHILYRFPSLQRTATDWLGRRRVVMDGGVETTTTHLAANRWQFSQADQGQRVLAAGLGALNLVAVVTLSVLLGNQEAVRQVTPGIVNTASQLLPFLQAYAFSFFLIPFVRNLRLQQLNAVIDQENASRMQWAAYLSGRGPELLSKRRSALQRAESTVIRAEDVVYTTQKDLDEQDLEGREWDRRVAAAEVRSSSTTTPR